MRLSGQVSVQSVRFEAQLPPPEIPLRERFIGAILGVAVGDALGCNLETLTPQQIRERHGVHREITGGQPTPNFHTWPRGAVTDDTQMTVSLADSLIAAPQWDKWDCLRRFVAWNRTAPPGRGKSTEIALDVAATLNPLTDDFSAGGKEAFRQIGKAGNGSLMRCAPIGLMYHANPTKLLQASLESCQITHFAPAAQASTVAYGRILAAAVRGELGNQASRRACYEAAAREVELISSETAAAIRSVPTLRVEDIGLQPNTLNTLKMALWAFDRFTDAEEALVTVVNAGGDTDTNAAVAGALFGAQYGSQAFPQRWVNALLERNELQSVGERLYRAYEQISANSPAW
jgi:ADP-ribosyl-[dinitrogen reductase] hydrolase